MALTFKAKGGSGDFKTAPAGNHIAVCNLVADLGIQPGSGLYPDPKHQVILRFEFPAERVDYQDKDGKNKSGPQITYWTFTASMHEKANLRKQLEGWRGKKFSDDEAEVFDVSKLLAKACLLNLVEKVKGDKVYVNPAALSALPRGTNAPAPEMPILYYGEDDKSQFEELPQWIRDKITSQIKPQTSHATGVYAEHDQSPHYDFDGQPPLEAYENIHGVQVDNDDIPF